MALRKVIRSASALKSTAGAVVSAIANGLALGANRTSATAPRAGGTDFQAALTPTVASATGAGKQGAPLRVLADTHRTHRREVADEVRRAGDELQALGEGASGPCNALGEGAAFSPITPTREKVPVLSAPFGVGALLATSGKHVDHGCAGDISQIGLNTEAGDQVGIVANVQL